MARRQMVLALALALAGLATAAQTADAAQVGEQVFGKFTRGLVNAVTGWVEIPKRVHETVQSSGPAAGFTWGVLRGFGHAFIRTVAGIYEIATFPFPAPPDYRPILYPEYIFLNDEPYEESSYSQ